MGRNRKPPPNGFYTHWGGLWFWHARQELLRKKENHPSTIRAVIHESILDAGNQDGVSSFHDKNHLDISVLLDGFK
ncbi:MAG: hypothetical protein AAB933_03905 [Patescibacteria group bacterium]